MRYCYSILLISLPILWSIAQEKENPELQTPGLVDSISTSVHQSPQSPQGKPLPKFDLPEFVITGVAATDLPKFEKITISDEGSTRIWNQTKTFQRDNETVELGVSSRDALSQSVRIGSTGTARLSAGTFFTTNAGLRSAYLLPDMQFVFGGNYHSSKGYAAYTDQSGGGIDGTVYTILDPDIALLRRTRLSGGFAYQSETYHLFGTHTPRQSRTTSLLNLGAAANRTLATGDDVDAHINFTSLSLEDSSDAAENQLQFGAQIGSHLWDHSLHLQSEVSIASHGVSVVDVSGRIDDFQFSNLSLQTAVHLTWAKGTGQNILRLEPQIAMQYRLSAQACIFASYTPEVTPLTLSQLLEINRYVSSTTGIQNQDVRHAGELGIDIRWSEDLRSRAFVKIRSIDEYGVFCDSIKSGLWNMMYQGKASFVSFTAEMFATLTRNDYFSSSIEVQSIHHELYGGHIPYIPSLEVSAYYRHKFTTKLSGAIAVSGVGKRDANTNGTVVLPAYLKMDLQGRYSVLNWLEVTLEVNNITNTNYTVWQGYQEYPFLILAGCSVQW